MAVEEGASHADRQLTAQEAELSNDFMSKCWSVPSQRTFMLGYARQCTS